jgi:hypothetical protein
MKSRRVYSTLRETKDEYQILVEESQGKKPLVLTKLRRYEDRIEMHLSEYTVKI